AREALANHEIQTGSFEVSSAGQLPGASEFSKSDENMVEALRTIANIEFLNPSECSWKDRAVRAVTIAREALDARLQYESGQEGAPSLQEADRDKSGPGEISLSDTSGLDREYEENDYGQFFSF